MKLAPASFCGIKFFVELKPAPARFLPRMASVYGVKVGPMESYCEKIHPNDKLPRGMEKKLETLRPRILGSMRGK